MHKITKVIFERLKLSYNNGFKPVYIDKIDNQFQFIPEFDGLSEIERRPQIIGKFLSARHQAQKAKIPVRRLWFDVKKGIFVNQWMGIKTILMGLKVVNPHDLEEGKLYKLDLEVDEKKILGQAEALEERAEAGRESKIFTTKECRRFQLIGGEGKKKEKLIKKVKRLKEGKHE